MTERKPPDMSFESFVERQIRTAQERGDFDNLPGKGKPLEGLDQPHDEMWWVKSLLKREKVSVLPAALELKREVERGLAAALKLGSEPAVRKAVKLLNAKIAHLNRHTMDGPPTSVATLNPDQVVTRWKRRGRARR